MCLRTVKVRSERYLVSPSLIWILSEDTTISYELEVSRQHAPFDRGVVAVKGVLGLIPRSRFLGEPSDGKKGPTHRPYSFQQRRGKKP